MIDLGSNLNDFLTAVWEWSEDNDVAPELYRDIESDDYRFAVALRFSHRGAKLRAKMTYYVGRENTDKEKQTVDYVESVKNKCAIRVKETRDAHDKSLLQKIAA